jgi:hypothetical protein
MRSHREDTCDTDRTWAPTPEETAEMDTAIDHDKIILDTDGQCCAFCSLEMIILTSFKELLEMANEKHISRASGSPIAGPSGTYRNSHRQDSVIPSSTQHNMRDPTAEEALYQFNDVISTTTDAVRGISVPISDTSILKFDNWQEKQLRLELFKLLLSFLNGINQFSAGAYETEAEKRMNGLLHQFWVSDANTVRSAVGDRYFELQTVWEYWTNMRLRLTDFQSTTGYFGKPGADWKEHLRRMDRVTHAKASIAFVDMKSLRAAGNVTTNAVSNFDNNLATIFDLLTQVDGCNGIEEFRAIRLYNEELLVWFS